MNERFYMGVSSKHHVWTDVAVFEDADAAKTIEGLLAAAGIETRTYDDKLFRRFLFLRPPKPTFRVQVREHILKTADEIVMANAGTALQSALRCPSCGSLRVSYPQLTRKFILPTIGLHLGIIFRILDHECYCYDCHFMWTLPTDGARPAPKPVAHFPFTAAR